MGLVLLAKDPEEFTQGLERFLGVPLCLVEQPEELGDGELLEQPDVYLVSQLARAVLL